MRKIDVAISNAIAWACFRIAEFFEDAGRRLKRCPDCGRSRYYGAPCV